MPNFVVAPERPKQPEQVGSNSSDPNRHTPVELHSKHKAEAAFDIAAFTNDHGYW